ncbi:hypothetical protein [Bacteroides acidifaciens]
MALVQVEAYLRQEKDYASTKYISTGKWECKRNNGEKSSQCECFES